MPEPSRVPSRNEGLGPSLNSVVHIYGHRIVALRPKIHAHSKERRNAMKYANPEVRELGRAAEMIQGFNGIGCDTSLPFPCELALEDIED
jgi:hypothetical protein